MRKFFKLLWFSIKQIEVDFNKVKNFFLFIFYIAFFLLILALIYYGKDPNSQFIQEYEAILDILSIVIVTIYSIVFIPLTFLTYVRNIIQYFKLIQDKTVDTVYSFVSLTNNFVSFIVLISVFIAYILKFNTWGKTRIEGLILFTIVSCVFTLFVEISLKGLFLRRIEMTIRGMKIKLENNWAIVYGAVLFIPAVIILFLINLSGLLMIFS